MCRTARSPQVAAGANVASTELAFKEPPASDLDPSSITFTTRLQALFSLPYRPLDRTWWTVANGPHTLSLEATRVRYIDGTTRAELPWGVTPRLLIMWLTTQAKLTESRYVDLGSNLSRFTSDIGMPNANGNQRTAALDQLTALAACRYTFSTWGTTNQGTASLHSFRQVADELSLWFSKKDRSEADSLIPSEIVLSEQFYREFVDHAIPLRTDHLRALSARGARGMALDVYAWLAYRSNSITRPTRISWDSLRDQFSGGGGYAKLTDFRKSFREAVEKVQGLHEFRIDLSSTKVVVLKPGPPPVRPRRPRRSIEASNV